MPIDFESLRREPDLEAPELLAYDATDRLLLDTAADALQASKPGETVVVGDRHGALTLGASARGAREIRVHQDALLGERALARNAQRLGSSDDWSHHDLGEELFTDARVVLLQLPDSLDAIREIADLIARHARSDVTLFAGGRVKHMSLSQNDVLARSFARVTPGLARQKSRVITASHPIEPETPHPFPVWGEDDDVSVRIAAFGATFGGATLDHGTRFLLGHLANATPHANRIVDLGCGNGVIAAELARIHTEAKVIATDQSSAAVRAAELTVREAGVADRVTVTRADATEAVPDDWADLIVLNPPFHAGRTVHEGIAHRLIRSCARAIRPGGDLWVVFNSHLRYRSVIEQAVGPAQQVARNRRFTVVRATRIVSYQGTDSATY